MRESKGVSPYYTAGRYYCLPQIDSFMTDAEWLMFTRLMNHIMTITRHDTVSRGAVEMTHEWLAGLIGKSEKQSQRIVDSLERLGVVRVLRTARKPNRYELDWDRINALALEQIEGRDKDVALKRDKDVSSTRDRSVAQKGDTDVSEIMNTYNKNEKEYNNEAVEALDDDEDWLGGFACPWMPTEEEMPSAWGKPSGIAENEVEYPSSGIESRQAADCEEDVQYPKGCEDDRERDKQSSSSKASGGGTLREKIESIVMCTPSTWKDIDMIGLLKKGARYPSTLITTLNQVAEFQQVWRKHLPFQEDILASARDTISSGELTEEQRRLALRLIKTIDHNTELCY